MKVLILHNSYQQRGGEDSVVEAEHALLESRGVEVSRYIADNSAIHGIPAKVRTLASVRSNPAAIAPVMEHIRRLRPNLVHVHNFFPLLSPGIHLALAQVGLPVVQTLHNYRLLCANGMFLRQGNVCEKCLHGSRLNALRHACYRGSALGSAAVLAMQNASIRAPSWVGAVSAFVALTDFARNKFIEGGLPPERIVVKPNAIGDPGVMRGGVRQGALFVGRLAPGKGAGVLVEAWKEIPDIDLTIIGDGPDAEALRRSAPVNIKWSGLQPRHEVLAAMARAQLLILPSTWYEGFPVTLVEAFACGVPVLASRIGGIPEIVDHGRTGFLMEPGDPALLRETVCAAFGDTKRLAQMGQNARTQYETRYCEQVNFRELMTIYETARAAFREVRSND